MLQFSRDGDGDYQFVLLLGMAKTMSSLIDGLRVYLADGVILTGYIETPSRFAP